MTEAEWLACTDPQRMLAHFEERVSRRKVRLLACACCRRLWASFNAPSQEMLLTAERYADRKATKGELLDRAKGVYRLDDAHRALALTAYRHASLNHHMEAINFA